MMDSPSEETSKVPDSEGIQVPDSEGIQVPDSEGIQVPDSEGIHLPDSEGIQISDSEGIPEDKITKENVVDTSDNPENNQKYLEIEEQIARIVGEDVPTDVEHPVEHEVFSVANLESKKPKESLNSNDELEKENTVIKKEKTSESENSVQEEEVDLEELENDDTLKQNEESSREEPSGESQYDGNDLVTVKDVKELFVCDKCEYSTQRETSLRLHNTKHHNKNSSWKCIHCKRKFPTKFLLNQHAELIHSKKFRSCPYCDFQIYGKDTVMRKHIKLCNRESTLEIFEGFVRKSKNGLFECGECSLTKRYMREMRIHVKLHKLKYLLHCMHCRFLTDKERKYHLHLQKNHMLARNVYICDRCFFQTETLERYEEHAKTSHEYHQCADCDYKTFYIEEFYSHCDKHDDESRNGEEKSENFAVDSQKDSSRDSNRNHENDVNDNNEIVVNVNEEKIDKEQIENNNGISPEDEDFGSPMKKKRKDEVDLANGEEKCSEGVQDLKKIRSTFTPKNGTLAKPAKRKKFECKHCEKTFPTIDMLVFHEKHVHKTNTFNCPNCVYKVDSGADFIVHCREHLYDEEEEEEEEELGQVEWEFSKTVRSPGKFSCKLCAYSADELKMLKDHLEAHHDVRYYQCAYCNFAQFTNPEDFFKHLNKHCSHCEFESEDPDEMKSHMLKHVPQYKNIDDEVICDGKIMKKKITSRPAFKIIPENPCEEIKIIIDTDDEDRKSEKGKITVIIEDLDEENCESEEEEREEGAEQLGEPVKIIRVIENQCFDCLRVFKNRTVLLGHRRFKHLSRKPHSCTYCFECFRSFYELKTHYYRVHKVTFHNINPVFGCPLCLYASDHLRETRRHVMRKHGRGVMGFKRRRDVIK